MVTLAAPAVLTPLLPLTGAVDRLHPVADLGQLGRLDPAPELAVNLQRWLQNHQPVLRADQYAAVAALFAREGEIAEGDITDDDAQALVQQVIGFPRLDESFAYVREDA